MCILHQTAEHLTLASLGKSHLESPADATESGDRSKSTFAEDESIPSLFRAKLKDYFRSGYDRGHMCAIVALVRTFNLAEYRLLQGSRCRLQVLSGESSIVVIFNVLHRLNPSTDGHG
jgi:hypothetical protein